MNSSLIHFDQQAFFFINQSLRNPLFDFVMPYLRNPDLWIPLYVVLVGYLIYRHKWQSIITMICAGITFTLTDQIASSIIKPAVHRLRPCHDAAISAQVHLLVDCGPGFSFISSHATNHFGIAVFVIFLLRKRFPWITLVALIWASLICFAQVYVGLHYPLDVICGGILGALIGTLTGKLCLATLKKFGAETI